MKTLCPHCGQHYELDESFTGKHVMCDACGKDFVIDPPKRRGGDQRTVVGSKPEALTRQDIWIILYWIRAVLAPLLVVVAFYQMFDVISAMDRGSLFEDSTLRETTRASQSMVYVGRSIMFMLLALFIKPGTWHEK